MLVNLGSPWRRVGLVLFAFAMATLYVWPSFKVYLAARSAAIRSYEGVQRAALWQPDNAEYQYFAGVQSLFGQFQPDKAIAQLTNAARLNPWASQIWLALANAYQITGDQAKERMALESALSADPKTPGVAWSAANLYLVTGDIDRAATSFRVVIENDPSRAELAFNLLWRVRPDINFVLKAAPPLVERHLSLLNVLCTANEPDSAKVVWDGIVTMHQTFSPVLAYPYIDFLIKTQQTDQVARVWEQLAEMFPDHMVRRTDNLIVNGGFEDGISNGGLDWRITHGKGVKTSVDPVISNSGIRSIVIDFNGWVEDAGIQQFVPVDPGAHYSFRGFMRSENIQTSSGPRFGIYDAYDNTEYALSDDMLESNVWRRQELQFQAGPNTHLVIIKVVREPANSRIIGKAWIDDLQLVKE